MAKRNSKSNASRPNGPKDAIAFLKGDHKIVKDMLQKMISSSTRPSRSLENLISKIEQEVKAHSIIEEEIFYPAFKESARKKEEQKLYFEAREEHHVVDTFMDEFHGTENNEVLAAKCKVFKELLEQHIKEEERDMFPLAKKVMNKEMLQDLGEKLEQRKTEIQSEMKAA